MKNVKIKVETEEQNLKVQKRLCDLNKENGRTAWYVFLRYGHDYYDYQDIDNLRAVSYNMKHFRFLILDNHLGLVICMSEDDWNEREEKEVSFDEFMEIKK